MTKLRPIDVIVAAAGIVWIVGVVSADAAASQSISNFGLASAALIAAIACGWTAVKADRTQPRIKRFWWLLGASALSWGLGQCMWTFYESTGRELPFPSLADVGYLGAVPLAAAALLSLPSGAQGMAGRVRTVLDGAIVAIALLVVSWTTVLATIFDPESNTLIEQVISLAYPIGDIISVTIVAYVVLRARETNLRPPVPMTLVSAALVAIAIADSGFTILTATDQYASGSVIDVGWFIGYYLVFAAAQLSRRQKRVHTRADTLDQGGDNPTSLLLPYGALLLSVVVSIIDVARNGEIGLFVSMLRTSLMLLIIVRQFLATHELGVTRQNVRARTAELRANRRRYEALALHSSDVVMVVDPRSRLRYVSGSIRAVLGFDPDEVTGRPLTEFLDDASVNVLTAALGQAAAEAHGTRTVEVRFKAGDRHSWAELTITNLLDNDDVEGLIINCHDVSERKTLEDQLVHLAFHDSLTALANRSLFKERVEEALIKDDTDSKVAVLFLDLDGFKQVNDSLGHAAGDLLLVMVSERLRTCVRGADIVARLGGDEFAILMSDAETDAAALRLAERISEALEEPFEVEGQEVNVRASVGISRTMGEATTGDELLRNADLAMYRAKMQTGTTVEIFHPRMHTNLVHRFQTEGAMRAALTNGEFELHYQPTMQLGSNRITGVEALIRWRHPERGMISPAEFIPIAEATGLIRDIGRWVLREACQQAVEWQLTIPGFQQLGMSVNLSAKEVQQPGLVPQVRAVLRETGMRPELLTLEMTESVLFEHNESWLSALDELRKIGVRLAIDDFGTGYSSLAYLHRFSADVLKIDRSFVERISGPERDSEIVNTIVRLGHSLDMMTIAEGIEDDEQVATLTRLGCDLGQGFHLARPMESDRVRELLEQQRSLHTPVPVPPPS